MTKIKLIYLKNQMFVANSIANFLGVLLVKTLMSRIQETFATEILETPIAQWTQALFSPFAFSFVGDVSGHGISSALLMATVRSSLRQRVSLPGSTAKIISDVNRHLVKDVEDSGQY